MQATVDPAANDQTKLRGGYAPRLITPDASTAKKKFEFPGRAGGTVSANALASSESTPAAQTNQGQSQPQPQPQPDAKSSGEAGTTVAPDVAAATGTHALLRRKNVLTLDLCDPALKLALVEFFDLYTNLPFTGNTTESDYPILLIFVDLSLGKVAAQRKLVLHIGAILERLRRHANPVM